MENISKYPEALKEPAAVLALQKYGGVNFPENYYALRWEDLHDLRSKTRKGCESLLGKAEKDKRDLNEAETKAFQLGMAGLDAIQVEFEAREKAGTKEPLFTGSINEPVQRAPSVSFSHSVERGTTGPAIKKDYRSMFRPQSGGLDKAGFNSFGDFLNSLTNRLKDERLDARTFVAKDAPSGGYSVPEYWAATIYDAGLENEVVRPRATVYPMESEVQHIPMWDNSNHSNGTVYGGFSIAYLGENQDATVQTGQLQMTSLKSKKVGIYTEISREAASSGISLDEQLRSKLTAAVSFLLDRDFLTGDGVGKPQGVLNSPSRINISRATASQVNYQDVYTMYGRLAPQSQAKAVWVASHSVLPQLMNMQVGNELVFNPITTGGIAGPVPMTLFGKPLLFTEKVSALGSTGDLMLVDFSQYAIGLRSDIVLDISNSPGWTRDVISLRAILRIDGVSLWQEPMTPLGGGNTLSWCVVLQ